MKNEFDKCLSAKKIIKFLNAKKLVEIEIQAAKSDLEEAESRFRVGKFKYATINAYYSLFHSARALLYQKGYRERSHYCLRVAIWELYVKEKLLDTELLECFDEAIGLREAADYESVYSKDGARRAIKGAEKFLSTAEEVLGEFWHDKNQ